MKIPYISMNKPLALGGPNGYDYRKQSNKYTMYGCPGHTEIILEDILCFQIN